MFSTALAIDKCLFTSLGDEGLFCVWVHKCSGRVPRNRQLGFPDLFFTTELTVVILISVL